MTHANYTHHGHSTLQALIYLIETTHEATDSGNNSVLLYFADFTKGFVIIDHLVLLDELRSFNVDQTPKSFRGYAPSLPTEHRLCVSAPCQHGKKVNGGVPQLGTKLGLPFLPVMINRLPMVRNWHMRMKYVDKTTAFEIIPRNSTSMLEVVVTPVEKFWPL